MGSQAEADAFSPRFTPSYLTFKSLKLYNKTEGGQKRVAHIN